ncbi:helix-turn-helix transcriptional regulator [Tropicimonas marinistellae]|uniref:helix-turn-helix transcriptional regulator n=1 Tax=Tropicimonas marinistellae TaxID=1739787 RepID=UPI00083547BE|nr:AraC family transcriptional regulator [Tropicimonas marinistellae]
MSELPLIRLNSAAVLVAAMDKLGLATDDVLDGVGLKRVTFDDDDAFVPALVVYQLCEDAAAAAENPALLALLGESVNTATWPPIQQASANASDLGQLLTRFAVDATEHSSALTQSLEVHGHRAVFYGQRAFAPSFVPAQIDAFFAALMASVIRRATGSAWTPGSVVVTVSEPKALPPFFFGIKAVKGDRRGYRIGFPATWLAMAFERSDFDDRSNLDTRSFPARTAASAVEQALKAHIGEGPLSSKAAAEFCGKSERALSRLLVKEQTSLGEIIARLKRDYAERMLKDTEMPVLEIAQALGYTPTSFARSFKAWSGKTPSEFRSND